MCISLSYITKGSYPLKTPVQTGDIKNGDDLWALDLLDLPRSTLQQRVQADYISKVQATDGGIHLSDFSRSSSLPCRSESIVPSYKREILPDMQDWDRRAGG